MTSVEPLNISASGWNRNLTHNKWLILATFILLVAAVFRLGALQRVPPGLAQDEILDADIALFIRGGENALFFRHGYGHEPLYHYWAAPFQPLFGDNILAIRLPSVFLGLLLVALTMGWARRGFGSAVALIAGAGLAIAWWPVIFSRIGIRPIMEPVILLLGLWFWPLEHSVVDRRGIRRAALAGVFLGISIYTYTAARIILLIPLLLLVVMTIQVWGTRKSGDRQERLRAQIAYAGVVLLAGVIVCLPLAVTLRANPDLQQRLEQLEGPLTALQAGDAVPVLKTTVATLGVFSFTGDPRWTYSLPNRPLFDPLTAVLFYVGLVIALWRWREPRYAILTIWLFIGLLPSALSPDAPSTVRLVGIMPVVYLLPGLGINASFVWAERHSQGLENWRRFVLMGTASLILILGINTWRTIRDGFIHWPQNVETRLRYQSVLSDIGRYWREEPSDNSLVVADGFFEPIDADSLRRAIGMEPHARWIQTGAGLSGGMVWPLGRPTDLFVPEYAPLNPDLIDLIGMGQQPLFRSSGTPSFAVYRLPEVPEFETVRIDPVFGLDQPLITLRGVTEPVSDGSRLALASLWVVEKELPTNIALFAHLVNEDGVIIAQYDGLDVAASTLLPGDVFVQRHELNIPEPLSSGTYKLRIGLYDRRDNQRLIRRNGAEYIMLAHCINASGGSESLVCRLTELR